LNNYLKSQKEVENLLELYQLASTENNKDVIDECEKNLSLLLSEAKLTEAKCFLSNENDSFDSYLEIHAGAGGTESQDWAAMLRRMYMKWADKKKYKDRLKNGNYVEDTGNHFVFILDKNLVPMEQALIAMKSTQKKKSKTWNSMMQSRRQNGKQGFFRPPTWSTTYRLTTTKESNSQNSWYGWVVEFDQYLNTATHPKTLEMTRGFYQSAMKSDIFGKIDFGQEINQEPKKAAVPF